MPDQPNQRIPGRDRFHYQSGRIIAAVINNDNLELAAEVTERVYGVGNHLFYIPFFVVRGQYK